MSTATLPSRPATRGAAGAVPDTRPWASYGRISKRKQGDGGGAHVKIAYQHADNQARIRQDVDPDATFVEYQDNMSAWDPDVRRDDWERLLVDLAAGKYRGVIAWHSSRYTRQPEQFERLWKACKRGGTELWVRNRGRQESALHLRIEGALDAEESDQKSERISRKHQWLREQGMFSGGRRRFGYEPGMVAIRESEAHWVRWAALGVIGGRSLNSLAKELNAQGVLTAEGKAWRGSNLGVYLRRPMLAGLRVHQGQVVGQAVWDPILDMGTWEACRELLSNPERRTSKSQARRYLLSGVARCGVCGNVLRGANNGADNRAQPAYRCERFCVQRNAALVDATVRAHVVARLSQVDAAGLLTAPQAPDGREALQAQVDALEGRLAELAEQAALGVITVAQMASATAVVRTEVGALNARLAELAVAAAQPAAVLEGVAGRPDAAVIFDALDLDRRRAIVDLLADVTVSKAPHRGAAFDPALVQVAWKS